MLKHSVMISELCARLFVEPCKSDISMHRVILINGNLGQKFWTSCGVHRMSSYIDFLDRRSLVQNLMSCSLTKSA